MDDIYTEDAQFEPYWWEDAPRTEAPPVTSTRFFIPCFDFVQETVRALLTPVRVRVQYPSGVNQTDGTHGTVLRVHPARRGARRDA